MNEFLRDSWFTLSNYFFQHEWRGQCESERRPFPHKISNLLKRKNYACVNGFYTKQVLLFGNVESWKRFHEITLCREHCDVIFWSFCWHMLKHIWANFKRTWISWYFNYFIINRKSNDITLTCSISGNISSFD